MKTFGIFLSTILKEIMPLFRFHRGWSAQQSYYCAIYFVSHKRQRKHCSTWRNLKTPAFHIRTYSRYCREHFENPAFRERWPAQVFPKHKSKTTGDCWVCRFLRRSVDETNWCVFKVKPPFSDSFGVKWMEPKLS